MPITLTDDLAELKAQAEGAKPFKPSALYDRLAALPWPQLMKLEPAERLAVGWYVAAQRRAEQMNSRGDASGRWQARIDARASMT